MKNKILFAVILFFCVSCGNQVNEKYSSEKKNNKSMTAFDGKENSISKKMKEEFQLTDMNKKYTDPFFIRGKEEYKKYINKNLVLPDAVKINGYEGTVSLNLTIDKMGTLVKYDVIKTIGHCPECTIEAIRIVKGMPAWGPSCEIDSHGNKLNTTLSHLIVNIDFRK